MKRLEKLPEKDKDQIKEEPKIKVCVHCSGSDQFTIMYNFQSPIFFMFLFLDFQLCSS